MLKAIITGLVVIVGIVYFYYGCRFEFQFLRVDHNISCHVYGQDIACYIVTNKMHRYFQKHQTYFKPLIFSFHGSAGTGKNYMSKFIVDFFTEKTELIFTPEPDFPNTALADEYARNVKQRIMSTVAECHVNIVILDEVERFPDAVMEEIVKSLDYFSKKENFPIIVLLLGNSRSLQINNLVFTTNLPRKKLLPLDFEFSRRESEWYPKKFWRKRRIVYVPFLPLEGEHVVKCIKDHLPVNCEVERNDLIKLVIKKLIISNVSIPRKLNGRRYSTYGCKYVSDKVDSVLKRIKCPTTITNETSGTSVGFLRDWNL